jgi:hypothetical protein
MPFLTITIGTVSGKKFSRTRNWISTITLWSMNSLHSTREMDWRGSMRQIQRSYSQAVRSVHLHAYKVFDMKLLCILFIFVQSSCTCSMLDSLLYFVFLVEGIGRCSGRFVHHSWAFSHVKPLLLFMVQWSRPVYISWPVKLCIHILETCEDKSREAVLSEYVQGEFFFSSYC